MNRIYFAFLAALAVSAPVAAQTENPYNGKWTLSFDGKKTIDLKGTVVIMGEGGTWHVVAQARTNPCVGREVPITVKKANAEELVFTVNRASLPGCKDSTYTFEKVDDKAMKGEVGGRAATLTRN